MATVKWGDKDPTDVDDFSIGFDRELRGETLTGASWNVPPGLTSGGSSYTTTAATVRLSGGTSGETYVVTATATTSGGRTLQRSAELYVTEL